MFRDGADDGGLLAAKDPREELGAVDARLGEGGAGAGAVVLAKGDVGRRHVSDGARGEQLAQRPHRREEAAPHAVQEEKPALPREREHLRRLCRRRRHALLTENRLARTQAEQRVGDVARRRRRDVHHVDGGVGNQRLVRAVRTRAHQPELRRKRRRAIPAPRANGDDFGVASHGGEDAAKVGGDAARAENAPADWTPLLCHRH
mmetsp:Transcript_39101/g.123217  ORF Transcript_39101/g.123217 Transcript_39101/m.123217 type:complete len:204 (+) Transcript_39101:648-1259(+)